MPRLFIACPLPDNVEDHLLLLKKSLDATIRAAIRFTAVGDSHLTFHFLGETTGTMIPDLTATIGSMSASACPELAVGELIAFPNAMVASVLAASVEDVKGNLAILQKEMGKKLERLGFILPLRRFRPHVTLGRFRSPQRVEIENSGQPSLPWRQATVALYESTLTPVGPQYTILHEASFI